MLRDTLARADACGLHVAPLDTLPRLQDIDTMQVGPGGGGHTAVQCVCLGTAVRTAASGHHVLEDGPLYMCGIGSTYRKGSQVVRTPRAGLGAAGPPLRAMGAGAAGGPQLQWVELLLPVLLLLLPPLPRVTSTLFPLLSIAPT